MDKFNVHVEIRGTQSNRTMLKKKNNVVGLMLFYFKTYYKVRIVKKCGTGTMTGILILRIYFEILNVNPHIYDQLFYKGANTISKGKEQ